jgi:Ca2+/Na+ antiporter
MKPAELFGVFVRATGFLIVLYGIWEIWGGFDNVVENILAIAQGDNSDQPSSFSYFAFGIPSALLGVLIFFAANWIVKLAYRDQSP